MKITDLFRQIHFRKTLSEGVGMRISRAIFAASLVLSVTNATFAEEEGAFSKNSTAKTFGFQEEEKALFTGEVVDVMCELSGNCADNCGNGNRLLGIVRDADNRLVLPIKNGQFSFNGPVEDLLPYCGKKVDVDGIMVGDAEVYGSKFYMVQKIRLTGDGEFKKANLWTKAWAKRNEEAAKVKGPWFRKDPRVLKQIEATGYFGLGRDADVKYAAENQ